MLPVVPLYLHCEIGAPSFPKIPRILLEQSPLFSFPYSWLSPGPALSPSPEEIIPKQIRRTPGGLEMGM